jgi:hypothetical protein
MATPISNQLIQAQPHALSTPSDAMMAYVAPDASMTLREGIAEYFRHSAEMMDPAELPPDLGLGLRAHDVAHVVFGCDTTLVGEVVLARWSLFGVTGSIRPYLIGLRRRETRGLFRDAAAAFRPAMLWRMTKFASLAVFRSLRMRERWPFEEFGQYLDQPLCEIRERFGIRVIRTLSLPVAEPRPSVGEVMSGDTAPNTTIEVALSHYLVAQGVATKGDTRADLYADKWFYVTVGGKKVPFFPRAGFRGGLPAHDTHHLLNGYSTNWVGECETAAWELASGGCGRYVAYWFDRLFFIVIALVTVPVRTARAFQRGWGQKNLYRLDPDELLSMDLAEVRRIVRN